MRLYYETVNRPSRPGMETALDPLRGYFLHSNRADYFMDNTGPTAAEPKYKDSPSVNRTMYKEIGAWSFTVQ